MEPIVPPIYAVTWLSQGFPLQNCLPSFILQVESAFSWPAAVTVGASRNLPSTLRKCSILTPGLGRAWPICPVPWAAPKWSCLTVCPRSSEVTTTPNWAGNCTSTTRTKIDGFRIPRRRWGFREAARPYFKCPGPCFRTVEKKNNK